MLNAPTALAFALMLTVSSTAPAQALRDTFTYPDGTTVPGWTQQAGTWRVRSGRLVTTTPLVWAYITKDDISARDCVIDAEVYIVRTRAEFVQFAGLTARHPGGPGDANLLMAKIQSNGNVNSEFLYGFERIFTYERGQPLGSYFRDVAGFPTTASCRLIAARDEFWLEVDLDNNGIYEVFLPRRPVVSVFAPGAVGISAYDSLSVLSQLIQIDNFEFFDAVLVPTAGAIPRLGTSYSLQLSTPAANVPWLGLLSTGRNGVTIGDRSVPLTLDDLLTVSLGFIFGGVTDANGRATMTIPLPPNPTLAGFSFYTSAITLDLSRPFGVGHIANEQYVRLVR